MVRSCSHLFHISSRVGCGSMAAGFRTVGYFAGLGRWCGCSNAFRTGVCSFDRLFPDFRVATGICKRSRVAGDSRVCSFSRVCSHGWTGGIDRVLPLTNAARHGLCATLTRASPGPDDGAAGERDGAGDGTRIGDVWDVRGAEGAEAGGDQEGGNPVAAALAAPTEDTHPLDVTPMELMRETTILGDGPPSFLHCRKTKYGWSLVC